MSESDNEHFEFGEGDTVLVRVRENGATGSIVAKFEAKCVDISSRKGLFSQVARFDLPWGTMESTQLRPYEAEFEVVNE